MDTGFKSKKLLEQMMNGTGSRHDVYGMRVKLKPDERLAKFAEEFEFSIPDCSEFVNEDGTLDVDGYYREFKKEWLSRYTYYKAEYEILAEEIEYMRERGNRLVSKITGMPRGSHSSRPEDEWVEIIEYTDKAIDYLCTISENLLYTLLEIEQAIWDVKVPEQRLILTMRYLRGNSIKEIQDRTHYSRSQVWKIERKALDKMEISCTDTELKDRMEKEYRRIEFELDHFDPEKVDPEVLNEYMAELLEDRSEAAKIIDLSRASRQKREKNLEKTRRRQARIKEEKELKRRQNQRKTGVITRTGTKDNKKRKKGDNDG